MKTHQAAEALGRGALIHDAGLYDGVLALFKNSAEFLHLRLIRLGIDQILCLPLFCGGGKPGIRCAEFNRVKVGMEVRAFHSEGIDEQTHGIEILILLGKRKPFCLITECDDLRAAVFPQLGTCGLTPSCLIQLAEVFIEIKASSG